jgi:Zn-dependent protease
MSRDPIRPPRLPVKLDSLNLSTLGPQLTRTCPSCGSDLPLGALACPKCHALVHGRELDALAREARALESRSDFGAARDAWNRSLTMLPPDSRQAEWIRNKLRSLQVASAEPPKPQSAWVRRLGPLGPLALVLLKAKGLLAAIFKLKFLFSLFSFVALYWALFGWRFGLGFSASILIHELGHYIDIKRRGWPAEMPVFLPGLGAYVRWQAMGVTLEQRAQVSLAGPLAGWVVAAACTLLYYRSGNPLWSALGRTGAVLNILNLIPVWALDGGQAAYALARPERLLLLAAALGLWLFSGETIFFFVAAGTVWRLFTKDTPSQSSWSSLVYYTAVLAALAVVLRALPASIAHR